MAVLVDPPHRDNPEGSPAVTAPPRLAEPPISGGRVEAVMGRLIKVLSHSPLARPLPAVSLSALGLAGVAVVGLCATAPKSSAATPPVLLPLTDLARNLGAPHLPDDVADAIMYVSLVLCCLGLAMMLWANSHGWTPSPRKAFAAAAGCVAVLVNITPVGSGDTASYAAYGRIAALGHNPYTFLPAQLPGGSHNPYTAIVNPEWRNSPSEYGPVATWEHMFAALIGGTRPWLTIWILMILAGVAYLATGYVLMRTAANPARAVLLWAANPIMIVELVMSGHLDAFLSLVAIAAIAVARRGTTMRHDLIVGVLVGVAGSIKVTAVFVALAIAIPLIHDRAWHRLIRTAVVAGLTTIVLYAVSGWGLTALEPLRAESKLVISPSVWRLAEVIIQQVNGGQLPSVVPTIFGLLSWPLMLALAWYLYNRLSPDVPTVVAATCALTFAWVIVVPWSLPWYTSTAWVALALLPRNTLTRWLTIVTGGLALLHFNGGFPGNPKLGPTP
ncbi:MAG TPA: hypothetical protein VK817_11600 [Trebonia sp.]|nr:hypothetical protein [Trebonia sp.]